MSLKRNAYKFPKRNYLLRIQKVCVIPITQSDNVGESIGMVIDRHLSECADKGEVFNRVTLEVDNEASRDYSDMDE